MKNLKITINDITINNITNINNMTTEQYIDNINYAEFNQNMIALSTSSSTPSLACNNYIIEYPVSDVIVNVNNIDVNVGGTGSTYDCFFSSDGGVTISNPPKKGDYLYWNNLNYTLDSNYNIDFTFFIEYKSISISANTTTIINDNFNNISLKFIGNTGDTAFIIISGETFTISNILGSLVFDYNGSFEHSFHTVGEKYNFFINDKFYTIIFDGFGSLLYSLTEDTYDSLLFNEGVYIDDSSLLLQEVAYMWVNDSGITTNNRQYFLNKTNANKIYRLNNDFTVNTSYTFGIFNNCIMNVYEVNNKLYVIGHFTTYNGIDVGNIVKLNMDGTIDNTFNYNITNITTSSIINNDIYLFFRNNKSYSNTFINDNAVNLSLIKITNDIIDYNFNSGCTGFVDNAVFNSKKHFNSILAAGNFTTYNGITKNRLVKINGDGSIDTTFNINGVAFNNAVHTLSIDPNNKIMASGIFTTYNNISRSNIVRLHTGGTLDTSFNFNNVITNITFNNINSKFIYDFSYDDSSILAYGGGFYVTSGTTVWSNIIKLNSNGTIDTSFNTYFDSKFTYVKTLKIYNNNYIISGFFEYYDGNYANGNIIIDKSGHFVSRIETNSLANIDCKIHSNYSTNSYLSFMNFSDYTKVNKKNYMFDVNKKIDINNNIFDDNINFNSYKLYNNYKYLIYAKYPCDNTTLYRLDINNNIDINFNTGVTNVRCLHTNIDFINDKIYITGTFTKYNNITANNIIRLNNDGTIDSSFNSGGTGFNKSVFKTLIYNDKIICCGQFLTYNGITVNRIVRLNNDGSIDLSFNSGGTGFNNQVSIIKLDNNNKIICHGVFTSYNGITVNRIVRLNSDGSIDLSFNSGGTGFNSNLSITGSDILCIQNDKYILGLNNTGITYNDENISNLIRLNNDGTLDTTFNENNSGTNDTIYTVILYDSKIFISGYFIKYNNKPRFKIAVLDENGYLL